MMTAEVKRSSYFIKSMKEKLLVVTGIVVALFFLWAVKIGLDRQAVADCTNFQAQAKEFKGFFLTANEAKMCAEINMPVDARVE